MRKKQRRQEVYTEINDAVEALALAEERGLAIKFPRGVKRIDEKDAPHNLITGRA